jgi:Fur family ferric uptake transcriptional regulator
VGYAARPHGTRQARLVRDALAEAHTFRSAQEVYASLRARGERVGLSTVYRHLRALAADGQIDVISTSAGEATYRLCGQGRQGHHHHLVCRSCGHAELIESHAVEQWAAGVAAEHGYTAAGHTVEVFGLCADCSG